MRTVNSISSSQIEQRGLSAWLFRAMAYTSGEPKTSAEARPVQCSVSLLTGFVAATLEPSGAGKFWSERGDNIPSPSRHPQPRFGGAFSLEILQVAARQGFRRGVD
jgi:hypothetical protein